MAGEVGGEEEKEEKEAVGRREGNTMADREDVFALGDEENALGGEDKEDALGDDEGTTLCLERLRSRTIETFDKP